MSSHADTSQFESKVVSLAKDDFVALLAENQRLRDALEEIVEMKVIDALIDVRDAAREALAGDGE